MSEASKRLAKLQARRNARITPEIPADLIDAWLTSRVQKTMSNFGIEEGSLVNNNILSAATFAIEQDLRVCVYYGFEFSRNPEGPISRGRQSHHSNHHQSHHPSRYYDADYFVRHARHGQRYSRQPHTRGGANDARGRK